MVLFDYGKIAQKYWQEIPDHFENITLDEFVVMPNHIHEILIVDRKSANTVNTVGSHKSGTIGVIINQYKRMCTICICKFNLEFTWQSRFHDQIIRDENELNRIRTYSIQHPEKWIDDQNNVTYLSDIARISATLSNKLAFSRIITSKRDMFRLKTIDNPYT